MAPDDMASAPLVEPSLDKKDLLVRYLLQSGKLVSTAVERAQHLAAQSNERLEIVLTRLGFLSERDLAEAFSDLLKLPLALISDFPDEPILEDRFNPKFLKHAQIIPLEDSRDAIRVAIVNPLDSYVTEAVRFAAKKPVSFLVAYPSDFETVFARLYGGEISDDHSDGQTDTHGDEKVSDDIDRLKDMASEAPVIRLVNMLITKAVEARASDIHFEPMENYLRVRYRLDGVLQEMDAPAPRLASAIISRIKIMAKLNIAERRLPQDGRISLAVRGKEIDFRVATTPTSHGEAIVLRILDRSHVKLDFKALGFDEVSLNPLREILKQPHGILLVTGPTGSGKTTTLYTALLELNTPDKKILTVEDPVEYQLPGINQVQIKPQIGLTFAATLRAFLRHDPDIMMVGEIRDLETAQIAVQAALTGHLILSTLHTNDTASAITRLLDMGVEDYLLTSTINGIAAQRLVRTLCLECREAFEPSEAVSEKFRLSDLSTEKKLTLYKAKGCDACNHSGYQGRSTIAEILPMTESIRQLVLKQTDASMIYAQAIAEGMETMMTHGLRKALMGQTTIEEILRVTRLN